jgi:phosphopentomutase
VIWIVLDSVGCGELPDAAEFGDQGSNTLCHTLEATGVELSQLGQLGLFNIDGIYCGEKKEHPIASFGKCMEESRGKDTTVGHWEMTGVIADKPLPTYPQGFPKVILDEFSELTGKEIIGNKAASGTAILDELGEEHMKTGKLIVYTSADSVFQIAAHEEVIPLHSLYHYCEIARKLLKGHDAVARVIARPFVGKAGAFLRTSNRRDYSLSPPGKTVLECIKEAGLDVIAVGKIEDIFNQVGITQAVHTKSNMDGVDQTLSFMRKDNQGLIFTNLVEFDSLWGHRNDVQGYGKGLKAFDNRLKEILAEMKETDVLIINADHGCDPTFPGTDHTREYIPLIVYGKTIKNGVDLGIRRTFADIGASVIDMLELEPILVGESFKDLLLS